MTAPGFALYAAQGVPVASDEGHSFADAQTEFFASYLPKWGRLPLIVSWFDDPQAIPAGTPTVLVAMTCDVPQALAYHTENSSGEVTGLIGWQTCKDDGVSWQSGASHEVDEATINPFVNEWVQIPSGIWAVAKEVCDPVQDGILKINGVELSNAVLPPWFDAYGGFSGAHGQFDVLGVLTAPFTKTSGGYYEEMRAGKVHQVGERRRHHVRLTRSRRAWRDTLPRELAT